MQHYWDWFCALPVAISVHYTLTEMRKTVSTHMHVHHIWCNVEPSSYNMTLPSATLQLLIAFCFQNNNFHKFVAKFCLYIRNHSTFLSSPHWFRQFIVSAPHIQDLVLNELLTKESQAGRLFFFFPFLSSLSVSSICTADNIRAVTDILWRTTFLFYIYFLRNVESLKTDFTSLQTQWNNQCLLFCAEALWVFLLNKSNQLIYNNDIILLIA